MLFIIRMVKRRTVRVRTSKFAPGIAAFKTGDVEMYRKYRRNTRGKGRRIGMNKVETKVVRSLSTLMPDRLRIPLQWHDYYTLQTPVAGPKQYAWRLNSPYDPDQPLGTSQKSAYGLSTLAIFYGKYRCFGSKIKMTIINDTTTSAGYEVLCSIYPSDTIINTTTDPNAKATAEKPYAKSVVLGVQTGGAAKSIIKHYASVKKLEGISSIEYEDNFAALTNADPADIFYWNFCFDNMGGNNQPIIIIDVNLIFYCEFYSRNNLTPN